MRLCSRLFLFYPTATYFQCTEKRGTVEAGKEGCSWKIQSLETLKTLTGRASSLRIILRMGEV